MGFEFAFSGSGSWESDTFHFKIWLSQELSKLLGHRHWCQNFENDLNHLKFDDADD